MEQDYSKRELDSMVKGIDEKLDAIHEQTTKTNGRVSKLEDAYSFIRGGLAVVTILIIPIILFIVYQYILHK